MVGAVWGVGSERGERAPDLEVSPGALSVKRVPFFFISSILLLQARHEDVNSCFGPCSFEIRDIEENVVEWVHYGDACDFKHGTEEG